MLEIPPREVKWAKRNADDVQVKRFVRSIPDKLKHGPQNLLDEVRSAMKAAYGSLSGYSGSFDYVFVV